MSRKVLEAYRRKVDFDAQRCTFIKLADGQSWGLARPHLEIRPVFRDGKAVTYTRQVSCGPELDVLIDAIAAQSEEPVLQIQSVLLLGALLLKRGYDVSDEELESLFRYRAGDPASEDMLAGIMEVATGKKP